MPRSEYEIIPCERIRHLHAFVVAVQYRNPHVHKAIEICLALSGRATVSTRNMSVNVEPGGIPLFNSNSSHEIRARGSEPVVLLTLQISNHFCMEYTPCLRNMEFTPPCVNIADMFGPERRGELASLLCRAARAYLKSEPASQFACLSLVCRLLEELLRTVPSAKLEEEDYVSRQRRALRIARIADYVDTHYQEKLMLSDIAAQEHVTAPYLSHFFRENLGMTFQEYLNNVRFEKAVRLVRDTDLRLLDVCMESGFSDYKYLNRTFVARLGQTPREYRKKLPPRKSAVPDGNPLMAQYVYSEEQTLALLEKMATE